MKVILACRVFSHSVASALKLYLSKCLLPSAVADTADFIENCERKCFDRSSCYQLHPHDFLNPERCQRNGFHSFF